jgi:hypothetical protein
MLGQEPAGTFHILSKLRFGTAEIRGWGKHSRRLEFWEGYGFLEVAEKTLILGGAAHQRCDNRSRMNKGFSCRRNEDEFFRAYFLAVP